MSFDAVENVFPSGPIDIFKNTIRADWKSPQMQDKRRYMAVAQSILDMITSGDYPPGVRLPSERDLAQKFGVSRLVIRDAEMSLARDGRVEIKRGSGVYVLEKDSSNEALPPNLTAFGLTQTRLLFESECAALAATKITDEQITELEATIDLMSISPVESQQADEADHAFHILIAKATGNDSNVAVLQNIWQMRNEIDAVKRVYRAAGHKHSSDRVNEHIDVMEALRNRDPIAARKAMRAHFTRLLKSLIDVSEEQAIEAVRLKSIENRKLYMNPAIFA
jgi:DNA-binding FadR family transcriptional regulator